MKTEFEILKKHDLSTDLQLLISRVHSLAMALNMQGNHQAIVQYRASIHSHGGHELSVDTKLSETSWGERFGIRQAIALPGAASTAQQRTESFQNLSAVINALSALLEQETPS